MVTWRGALEGAARLAICTAIDTVGNAADVFSNVFRPFPISQRLEAFSNAARLICNDEPPDYESQAQPFFGGQCVTAYRITVTVRDTLNRVILGSDGQIGTTLTYQSVVFGKIDRVESFPINGNPAAANVWAVRVTSFNDRSGNPIPGNGSPRTDSITRQINVFDESNFVLQLVNVSLERVDGEADNCGNPQPVIPPPENNYNITNVNVTYQNNDGVDIIVPVTFFVGQAFLDLNAEIQIPVNFTINANVSFPINFNLSTGGFTFNFQPTFNAPDGSPTTQPDGTGSGRNRPDDFTFDDPPPPPPSGDEFDDIDSPEDPKTERVIRAVGITASISVPSDRSIVYQTGGNPDIYVPDLGMVQFLIRVGNSVFWTNNIRVLNVRAFIECPWEGGAIEVAGTPRPGVSWELTPIYAKSELTNAQTG